LLDQRRFAFFAENLQEVNKHNSNPERTWNKALTKFADRAKDELHKKYSSENSFSSLMSFLADDFNFGNFYLVDPINIAEGVTMDKNIDWTDQTGEVGNQGECGCCYAFAMTNAIESAWKIKTGQFIKLSRQETVDCNTLSHGCNGGNAIHVGAYATGYGLNLDSDYPYEGRQGTCKRKEGASKILVEGVAAAYSQNKKIYNSKFLYALLQKGPVSIALDGDRLNDYENGILDISTGCLSPNHAVLLVGFGTDPKGNYWKIKNNWGADWGEHGYFRAYVKDDDYHGNCFMNQNAWQPYPASN